MNLFSYLKSQLSILTVVGDYATLKKAGLYWKGSCPFHTEKTASFTVSPHKEIFYCFGCHSGGDVISFMAKIEHCTPMEAAKQLIERYGITVPEHLCQDANFKTAEHRNHYFDLCKAVALWMHQMLLNNHAPQQYLKERNLDNHSFDYFTLGYFPGGPQSIKSFLHAMQRQNFLADDLLQANILSQGKTVLYSPFEERILFPIKDHLGRFCGFGGRTFKPLDERAKYYNSRENSYFSKGALLFGLDMAKHDIQKKETVFLVEGYTDCIAMVQHGFTNTVATLGTACTLEHLTTLARYAQRLFVLYDGDHAGQEAILRLTQLCWNVNMELKVICLPSQEDPASFLGQGKDINPLVNQAIDIFEFFIHALGKDFASKTLSEKLQGTKKILDLIQKIDDPLKRDLLLQNASTALTIPFQSMKDALNQVKKTPKPMPAEPVITTSEAYPELEKMLFFAILHNIELFNRDNEEYLLEYLPHPLKTILLTLKKGKEANKALNFTQFFDMLDGDEQQCVSSILLQGDHSTSEHDFEQLLLHLHKKHWKHIVQTTKTKLALAEAQADKEKIEKILHNFLELKKKMFQKNSA